MKLFHQAKDSANMLPKKNKKKLMKQIKKLMKKINPVDLDLWKEQ